PALLAACRTSNENQSASSHEGQAQVTHIIGTANLSSQGAPWEQLEVGTFLRRGDAIRTGVDSEGDLRFYKTGPVARLKPSSELKFVKMERWGWTTKSRSLTQLELIQGHVLVDDKKLPKDSKLEVRTAAGIVSSKGDEENRGQQGMRSV